MSTLTIPETVQYTEAYRGVIRFHQRKREGSQEPLFINTYEKEAVRFLKGV